MKKIIIASMLLIGAIGGMGFIPTNTSSNIVSTEISSDGCHYGQCQATAASTGRQCQHCVSNAGDSYCWQH